MFFVLFHVLSDTELIIPMTLQSQFFFSPTSTVTFGYVLMLERDLPGIDYHHFCFTVLNKKHAKAVRGDNDFKLLSRIPTAPSAASGSSHPPGLLPDPSSSTRAQVGLVAAYQPPRGGCTLFLGPGDNLSATV